jgi:hypothetical protein
MEREIVRDEQRFVTHFNPRPRHTIQLDYYVYQHDLRKRVIPAGQERGRAGVYLSSSTVSEDGAVGARSMA